MKDRLVGLLTDTFNYTKGVCIDFDEAVEINADHLLANGVIVLPCKVGDTVYIVEECGDGECAEDYVLDVKVSQFFINEHGIAVDLALPLGIRLNTWMEVGKNVFLTREEAEKALERRNQ